MEREMSDLKKPLSLYQSTIPIQIDLIQGRLYTETLNFVDTDQSHSPSMKPTYEGVKYKNKKCQCFPSKIF